MARCAIPGHGKLNARVMVAAGAARSAGNVHSLQALLRDAACGRAALPAATQESQREAVVAVLTATT